MFEEISGLKVNFQKSLLTSVNVPNSWLREASQVLNCKTDRRPFLYLGIPIGGDCRRPKFWDPVLDRIKLKMTSWKRKHLSLGGRLILLKSVMSSLLVYFLSFFMAPSSIISSI